ncbi:oxidoreductase [Pseudomaricurvus hydrocarbonicus]
MKTALVIGATGVTGQHIVTALLESDAYDKVVVFSRRPLTTPQAQPLKHPKLISHCVDFERIPQWSRLIQGNDLFSALGTTRKQAGSKAGQYQVDYTFQAKVIAAASEHGVDRLFLVSAPGANARSKLFYSRIKGELDEFAIQQNFKAIALFKPAIIEGVRPDKRWGEKLAASVTRGLCRIPGLRRFRPITGQQLGQSMVKCAEQPLKNGTHTFELDSIFEHLKGPPK